VPIDLLHLSTLAQDASGALAALPWGAHAIAGAGALVGVALLLAGRKLLRAGIVLAAAVIGGALGFYAPPSLGIALDPHLMLAAGLALGAIAGLVLYRATISLTFMALLAIAGPLIAAGAMRLAAATPLAEETRAAGESALALGLNESETFDAAAEEAWQRVRSFTSAVLESARTQWDSLQTREKSVLMGSSMLGAALGLFFGAMFPRRVAALMSASLGAGLLLPSAAWLLEAFVPAVGAELPTAASVWLALWAGLSVVGAAIQWTGGKRRTDS